MSELVILIKWYFNYIDWNFHTDLKLCDNTLPSAVNQQNLAFLKIKWFGGY